MQHRREGFAQQRLFVLPEAVAQTAGETPLLKGLLPVATGFFPAAQGHRVRRAEPLSEAIFILCLAGRGWVSIGDGKRETVTADTLALIPPGAPHAYGADEVEPWSIHWAHLRGDDVAAFAELLGMDGQSLTLRFPRGAARAIDFTSVHDRLEEDYTVANLLSAAAQMRAVLSELYRLRGRHPTLKAVDPVERTIDWMRAHLDRRANLSELASRANLSVAQYSTVFRSKTGYSPVDFFLRLKIQHACRLLDSTSLRIESIALAVGYDDSFYFSRLFRRIMGKPPRDYRSTLKG